MSSTYTGTITWSDGCRFSGNTAGDSDVPVGGNGGAIYTVSSGRKEGRLVFFRLLTSQKIRSVRCLFFRVLLAGVGTWCEYVARCVYLHDNFEKTKTTGRSGSCARTPYFRALT